MEQRHSLTAVYPAALRLAGRRVGGGRRRDRRPAADRRPARRPRVDRGRLARGDAGVEALADGRGARWARRPYAEGDLAEAWYAVAAADDPAVNAAVGREAEAGRVFCSRADAAEASSAWTPAVGTHDGVTVAVIGGGDPRRAVDAARRRGRRTARGHPGRAAAPRPRARRRAGRRRAGRPGPDHRARPAAARRGGRRGRRPAGPARPARRTARRRRDHGRLEDPLRPLHGPGGDQPAPDRPGQGGQVRGPAQGRGPVRLRARPRGDVACAEAGVPVTVVPG